jgi:hypothetical protein
MKAEPKNEPRDSEDIRPVHRDVDVTEGPSGGEEGSFGFYFVTLVIAVLILLGIAAYLCRGPR